MSEKITVFDIEVLNMDPASICSIGIVELEDFAVVNTYYSLIQPHNLSFDIYRYNVHHIRPKSLRHAPTFKEVWEKIRPCFENRIVVSHDIQGDMACLRAALKRDHLNYPHCRMSCTNVLAHMIEPHLEKYRVAELCDLFHIPLENAHNALADAIACSEILKHLVGETEYKTLTDLHKGYQLAFGEMKKNYYRNIISPEHAATNSRRIHKFTNCSIAFTGNMITSKEELQQQLKRVHAYYNREVNSHTSYLVIGTINYKKVRFGHSNKKVMKALALKKEGQDIRIIHEQKYLSMLAG